MAAKLIAYQCVATDHQPSHLHPDKLTIYDGHWAFCAFDARANGHKWDETGGEQLEILMRHAGLIGGVATHDAKMANAV